MLELALWWSDEEWNIHWNAAADSVAAFRLAVDIAARLGGGATLSYRVNAPWEPVAPVVEAAPEMAAAVMADLWRRETRLEGTVSAGGMEYTIVAITEGDGGQLSFQSPQGVFGSRYEDLVEILRHYATEQNIRIHAPLQELSFG